MSPIVSESLCWEEGGRLYTQLRTNVGMEALRARLRAAGLTDRLIAVAGHFDPTRLRGGDVYLLTWAPGTRRGEVMAHLERL